MNILNRFKVWRLDRKLIKMIDRDRSVHGKIVAIKAFRAATGLGLKESKDHVDRLVIMRTRTRGHNNDGR